MIAVGEVGSDEQIERLGINDFVTTIARAFDTCRFALSADLLNQVLSVAVCTESMAALHGEALMRSNFAADVAHEVAHDLYPWWATPDLLTKPRLIEHHLLIVHVVLYQTLLIPSTEP